MEIYGGITNQLTFEAENEYTYDLINEKRLVFDKSRKPTLRNVRLQKFGRKFVTDSYYEGEWNRLDMEGYGKFTFPHGVVYEGGMRDGEFHGEGILKYPKGQVIKAIFNKGTMTSVDFTFRHGYKCELKEYCKFPDRRFANSVIGDFMPPGRERLTNSQPSRNIPEGHVDVGDGFYDPKTKWIYNAASFYKKGGPTLSRVALEREKPIDLGSYQPDGNSFVKKIPFVPIYKNEKFILDHCRKAWDEPTGYKPELYEKWMSGRKKECERYRKKFSSMTKHTDEESNSLKLLNFFSDIVAREKLKVEQGSQMIYHI